MHIVSGLVKLVCDSFNKKATWTVDDMPDLTGKVTIVTGGNTRIGFETAKALLNKNATVYIGAQNARNANDAISTLVDITRNSKVHLLQMDFADLSTITKAVAEFSSKETRLDILFNNAGVTSPPTDQLTTQGYDPTFGTNALGLFSGTTSPPADQLTVQGYDLAFGANVLGPYYFTKLLLPLLERTAAANPTHPSRIIDISSDAHLLNANRGANLIDYETVVPSKKRIKVGAPQLYIQSKSASILMSKHRARAMADKAVVCISLSPGRTASELNRNIEAPETNEAGWLGNLTPGAITSLYAGSAPEAATKSGKYFVGYAQEKLPRPDHIDNIEVEDKLVAWLEKQLEIHVLH